MPYVEFPGDEITEVHFKKDDPGHTEGGPGGGPCMAEYSMPEAYLPPWWLYIEGATVWINPHTCCPPHYFPDEMDYGQKTVWGGTSKSTTITYTSYEAFVAGGSVDYLPFNIGIWIYPNIAPTTFNKVFYYELGDNGEIALKGPQGAPIITGVGTLTYEIPNPIGLTSFEPDPGVNGTTIVICTFVSSVSGNPYGHLQYGLKPNGSASLVVTHECGPNDFAPPADAPALAFERPSRIRKR